MSDENTNSGASTSTESQVTPQTSAPATSPSDAFASDAPDWIKSDAKLLAAHNAAPKPGAAEEPAQPTAQPATTPAVQPVQPAAQPAAAAAPQFDAQTIARAVSDGVRQALPQQPAAGASDADIARQLQIFTATPETFQAILGIAPEKPEQVRALNDALQGVARQAVTIAKTLYQQDLQAFRAEISPYLGMVRDSEATRQRETFFKEQPDLSGYEPLVQQVFEAALASGQRFGTTNEARQFVATRTRELLKSINVTPVTPTTTRGAAPSRTTTSPSRPMSPTSVGGRNGGTVPAKAANSIESVWGTK